MIVYRLVKTVYARDLSGRGAELAGGRWNSKGIPMLYTSSSRSLCLAEVFVHVSSAMLLDDYSMVVIEAPEDSIQMVSPGDLPGDWRDVPAPASTRHVGDTFSHEGRHLVLQAPSVIVPEEYNFLINPRHADFEKVSIIHVVPFMFDARFFRE